jgi:hypothetical protein
MRPCLCSHGAADHHLDGMAVKCWGELAYAETTERGFLVAHCACTVYEPAMTADSLNPS